MTANVSSTNSPMGGFDVLPSDDESWAFLSTPVTGSLSESSVAFLPSPASRSLASYGVVARPGHGNHGLSPSLSNLSLSPGPLQMATTSSPSPSTSPAFFPPLNQNQRRPTSYPMQLTEDVISSMNASGLLADSQFMVPPSNDIIPSPDAYLVDQRLNAFMPNYMSAVLQAPALEFDFAAFEREQAQHQLQSQASMHTSLQQPVNLDTPLEMHSTVNVQPWNAMDVPEQPDPQMFMMEGCNTPSPPSFVSASPKSSQDASPRSTFETQPPQQPLYQIQQFQIQQFLQQQQSPMRQQQKRQSPPQPAPAASIPLSAGSSSKTASSKLTTGNLNKVRGSGTRIEKRRTANSSATIGSANNSVSSDDKFIIVTPTTISSHAGNGSKHNLFECLEAMSTTQKGRKGPLAEEVKEGALQVRRLGACFCCHARKVRCDAQRPCKNCIRLATSTPQVICWRFDDFLVELFPVVIRSHLRKDEMTAFVFENVAAFTHPCAVRLTCGASFKNSLEIRGAKFFTAKSSGVLRHERLTMAGNQAQVASHLAAPIGLDLSEFSGSSSQQQDKLKKVLRAYVENIMEEDHYVNQLTADIRQSSLPRNLLTIVRRYYLNTKSPIVRQALVIYTMHYMMAHLMSLTRETVQQLRHTGLVPQDDTFVTSRLLNRQVKAILDEMMQEEVDKLFRMFARELKPKSRSSWAPCLAAFLILCLFMESISIALDNFAASSSEGDLQNQSPPQPVFSRTEAVKLSRAIESMPFRQFAYQFHHIYQTEQATPAGSSNTANSSSPSSPPSSSGSLSSSYGSSSAIKPAFNPLTDNRLLVSGDLDGPAVEMATSLRKMLTGDSLEELRFLNWDVLADTIEPYSYPRNVSFNYTGRLCSRFLLSFLEVDTIFKLK